MTRIHVASFPYVFEITTRHVALAFVANKEGGHWWGFRCPWFAFFVNNHGNDIAALRYVTGWSFHWKPNRSRGENEQRFLKHRSNLEVTGKPWFA